MNEKWLHARKLLCIRLDYLGDVLMCTPAIRALRESLPGCRITLLSSASGAAAAPYIPEIDDTLVYAAPWMKNSDAHGGMADLAFMETLHARQYDAAIIFTTYSQSPLPAALLCHLAGIPLRLAHCRENPYLLLTDWIPDPEPDRQIRHEVQRQLDLVATIACKTSNKRLSFQVKEQDRQWIRKHLQAYGLAGTLPWILCHPGATASSRRYPPYLWAQALKKLAKQTGMPIVFTGSTEENALIEEIRQTCNMPAISLAGEIDLGQLGAAISLASLVISNNTGPAHMAAAIGTPLIDLYALTNPQHSPWMANSKVLFHDVPCRFCYKSVCPQGHHHCLTLVHPDQIVRAAHELLSKTPTYRESAHEEMATLFLHNRQAKLTPDAVGLSSTTPAEGRAE